MCFHGARATSYNVAWSYGLGGDINDNDLITGITSSDTITLNLNGGFHNVKKGTVCRQGGTELVSYSQTGTYVLDLQDTSEYIPGQEYCLWCDPHSNMDFRIRMAPSSSASQDPHLKLANGATTDFRGRNNTFFNFISSPGFSLNMKIHDADFMLHKKLLVHGSFMTEAHLLTRHARVSLIGSKIGPTNLVLVNGTCHEKSFKLGAHRDVSCEGMRIQTEYSSVRIQTNDWVIMLRCNRVYDKIKGPDTRIDLEANKLRNVLSHGILGQSYYLKSGVTGELDEYPSEGEFTTHAMAQGVIEGTYVDYIVRSAFDNEYKYSIYNSVTQYIKEDSKLGTVSSEM